MKFEPAIIYFNKIYVIQSLPSGYRKTGEELYDDIIRRRTSSSMEAEVKLVNSQIELINYLKEILDNISAGRLPFIHLETHGYSDGIQLSNGDVVTWQFLSHYFQAINTATKNNLFISVAACTGGSIQFCVKTTEPCPFRGFIGPTEEVTEFDILTSFSEFFNVLMLHDDFDQAIDALNAVSGQIRYHYMNAERFFDLVWANEEKNWKENPREKKKLVEHLMKTQLARDPNLTIRFGSTRKFRRNMAKFVDRERPKVFELLKKQFCHETY